MYPFSERLPFILDSLTAVDNRALIRTISLRSRFGCAHAIIARARVRARARAHDDVCAYTCARSRARTRPALASDGPRARVTITRARETLASARE